MKKERGGGGEKGEERTRLPRVGFSRKPFLVGVLVKSDVLQRLRQRLRNRRTSSHGARRRRRLLQGKRRAKRTGEKEKKKKKRRRKKKKKKATANREG